VCLLLNRYIPATQTTAPQDTNVLQLLMFETVSVVQVATPVCYFSERGIDCWLYAVQFHYSIEVIHQYAYTVPIRWTVTVYTIVYLKINCWSYTVIGSRHLGLFSVYMLLITGSQFRPSIQKLQPGAYGFARYITVINQKHSLIESTGISTYCPEDMGMHITLQF
jgi:hypothetical protein